MRDRARHRLTMAFGAAICGMLLLSACGNLPRPFGREDDVDASGVRPEMFFEAVQVSPVAGTTKPMGTLLAQAVSERLQSRYEIPSALDGLSKGRFHLTGSVVEAGSG
ncbi:MAG: hypothetical protein O2944_10755, partial [Proteobacteria bacterium]|nr:hypothetical protein [Pseudomonadota bacterium]